MNSNFRKALVYSLYLLTKRDYTKRELERKIIQKFEEIDSQAVIKFLEENNYISDYKTAYNYTISKMEKGWGKRKIKAYLKQKGISEHLINHTFQNIEFDYSYIEKEITKKFSFPLSKKEKEKLIRFLQQRGFSFTEIYNIINGKI